MRAAALLLVLLAGCTNPLAWEVVTPLEPLPAHYAALYAEVERCLGMSGDFEAVQWFQAEDIAFEDGSGRIAGVQNGDRITIREDYIFRDLVVSHEIIHHITGLGNEDHETWPFLRCEKGT